MTQGGAAPRKSLTLNDLRGEFSYKNTKNFFDSQSCLYELKE
jgi:hypothetical protein